jgi:hypothetical protein
LFVEHSISHKSHALSSSCNIDHFVVQLIFEASSPLNSHSWCIPSYRYMELGSYLFLQQQIKDIIIVLLRLGHSKECSLYLLLTYVINNQYTNPLHPSHMSAAHVAVLGVFQSSDSGSWSIHSHPQRFLSIRSHLTPLKHATNLFNPQVSEMRRHVVQPTKYARDHAHLLRLGLLVHFIACRVSS